jgi:hypothetical protein
MLTSGVSCSLLGRATSDPGALNRAEWVKFVAPFFNKELEANKVFEDIKTGYTKTKSQAAVSISCCADELLPLPLVISLLPMKYCCCL